MDRRAFVSGGIAFAVTPPALARAAARRTDAFTARMRAIAASVPGVAGVYACTMASERPIFAHNVETSFPSASVIKLVIMLTAFEHEASAPGALQRKVTFDRANLIGGSPFMAQQPDGARFTVLQLIRPMIQLSDNTAANALIGYYGVAEIDRVGRAAGLKHTHLQRHFLDFSAIVRHEDNVTSAADMAHLLFEIERGAREDLRTLVPAKLCREMIEILLGQTDKEGIPDGVPGVPVANKTGAIDGVRNDVGIVDPFGDSPFVLSILTKRLDDYAGAYLAMQRFARVVYHHLAGTQL